MSLRIKKSKAYVLHCDLTNVIVSLWYDDDLVSIYEQHQIQMHFAILTYYCSGKRIRIFIPSVMNAQSSR
jgi:hypothetical protein